MGDQEMQVYVLEAEVSPRVFNSRINTKIQICFNLVVTRSILNCWAGSLSQILLKFQKSFLSPPVRNSSWPSSILRKDKSCEANGWALWCWDNVRICERMRRDGGGDEGSVHRSVGLGRSECALCSRNLNQYTVDLEQSLCGAEVLQIVMDLWFFFWEKRYLTVIWIWLERQIIVGVFSVGRNLQQKIIRRKNWAVLVSGARGREYFVVTPFQGCNQLHPNLE